MPDLAELGLKVDSAQVLEGSAALKDFSKEAQTAGEAADDAGISFQKLTSAAAMGGPKTDNYAKALAAAYGVTEKLNDAQIGVIRSLEDQTVRLTANGREYAQYIALRKAGTTADTQAGAAIANLAGITYDLDVQANKHNNTLTQQRARFRALADAAGITGSEMGMAIRQTGLLTLATRHLSPMLVGAAAGLGLLVTGLIKYVQILREAAEINQTAKISETSGNFIQGIGAAFSKAGGQSKDITQGMVQFNQQVDLARRGVGDLAVLFRANGVAAQGTEDAFFRVADLVKNARSEAEKFSIIQQAGLPVSNKMVQFLSQGADAIRRQSEEASKLSEKQLQDAEELEKKFNELWTNFTTWGKSAIVDVADTFRTRLFSPFANPDTLLGKAIQYLKDKTRDIRNAHVNEYGVNALEIGLPQMPTFAPPASSSSNAKTTVDPAAEKAAIALLQLHVTTLGQLATVQDLVALKQKELNIANMDGAGITRQQQAAIIALTEAQANGTLQLKQQSDQTRIQVDTLNMSRGAAAAYTAEQTKLQEALLLGNKSFDLNTEAGRRNAAALHEAAQQLGKDIDDLTRRQVSSDIKFGQKTMFFTPEDVQIAQQLKDLYPDVAEAMGSVEAQALRMTNSIQGASQAISSGLTSSLVSIVDGSQTAGQAFKGFAKTVIDAIAKMVIQLSIVGPLMRALGFGGFGAIDPVQNGGFGNGGFNFMDAAALKSADGNVFHNGSLQMFARGGLITRPTVFPMANGGIGLAGEAGTEAIMPLARDGKGRLGLRGQGGGGTVVYQTVNQDFRGTDASQRAFLTQQIRASSIQTRKAAVTDVAATKRNVPGYLQ